MNFIERTRGSSFCCITCGAKTSVKDSRPIRLGKLLAVRRRRLCQQCRIRFNTVEISIESFKEIDTLAAVDSVPTILALKELEAAMRRLSDVLNGR